MFLNVELIILNDVLLQLLWGGLVDFFELMFFNSEFLYSISLEFPVIILLTSIYIYV